MAFTLCIIKNNLYKDAIAFTTPQEHTQLHLKYLDPLKDNGTERKCFNLHITYVLNLLYNSM